MRPVILCCKVEYHVSAQNSFACKPFEHVRGHGDIGDDTATVPDGSCAFGSEGLCERIGNSSHTPVLIAVGEVDRLDASPAWDVILGCSHLDLGLVTERTGHLYQTFSVRPFTDYDTAVKILKRFRQQSPMQRQNPC